MYLLLWQAVPGRENVDTHLLSEMHPNHKRTVTDLRTLKKLPKKLQKVDQFVFKTIGATTGRLPKPNM